MSKQTKKQKPPTDFSDKLNISFLVNLPILLISFFHNNNNHNDNPSFRYSRNKANGSWTLDIRWIDFWNKHFKNTRNMVCWTYLA